MTEKANARTRLLCLVEILTMYSDEQHILSIEEICDWLRDYGYEVTKRNVLSDIKAINTTPIKVISVSKPRKGYYIAKYFSQDAIGLILEAVFSSEILTEKDINYIQNYLRRCACIPTLDLVLSTTMNLNSFAQKREIPGETVRNLRIAIKEKRQAVLTVSRAVPGDVFSANSRKKENVTVNPITIVVSGKSVALVFSEKETPKKAEFIPIERIENIRLTDNEAIEFSDDLTSAVNYFNGEPSQKDRLAKEWLLLRFRTEDIELVESRFSSPVQFKKDDEDGYCVAKISASIDYSLIGWLVTMSDKIEIIAPHGLKKLLEEKIKT